MWRTNRSGGIPCLHDFNITFYYTINTRQFSVCHIIVPDVIRISAVSVRVGHCLQVYLEIKEIHSKTELEMSMIFENFRIFSVIPSTVRLIEKLKIAYAVRLGLPQARSFFAEGANYLQIANAANRRAVL